MNINEILLPTLIFVGLGALAGLLLAIFSKIFAVPTNETAEKIKDILPGLNCGVCGFSGCEDYANALANNPDTKTNLCVPGGSDTAGNISNILGKAAEAVESIVAEVYCNGTNIITPDIFEYDGILTCDACNMYYAGKSKCNYGCLGLGDCLKQCPYGAITIINSLATINTEKCIGCGMCTKVCPKELIGLRKKAQEIVVKCFNCDLGKNTRSACKIGCIGCKKCEKVCKHNAIFVENNKARIDYSLCTNCKECVAVCPSKCIIDVNAAS